MVEGGSFNLFIRHESTKRRQSKSALSTNSFFLHTRDWNSPKIQQKIFCIHTYSTKRYLTVIISSLRNPSQPDETLEPPQNGGMPISDIPNDTSNQHYHNRDVAHAAEVNYENNRYITPLNIEFGSTESDNTVNFASKHCKLFAAIKWSFCKNNHRWWYRHTPPPKKIPHGIRLCNKIRHHQWSQSLISPFFRP